jgi:hypothetical protein
MGAPEFRRSEKGGGNDAFGARSESLPDIVLWGLVPQNRMRDNTNAWIERANQIKTQRGCLRNVAGGTGDSLFRTARAGKDLPCRAIPPR